MSSGGARTWYFPDGYLPEKISKKGMEAHESLMLLNTGASDACVTIDIFFSDRPPLKNIGVNVPAERVIGLRLDQPQDIGGHEIPVLTQYALKVVSDTKIVAQFGRLDTTQDNMAYYGAMGYNE